VRLVPLRETLRIQSIRDPLTGLYNRRYMEETINREIPRATRYQRPVGITVLEGDDDFVADARPEESSKTSAGQQLPDAHPRGAPIVCIRCPVPMELHLDTAVFVDMDLVLIGITIWPCPDNS